MKSAPKILKRDELVCEVARLKKGRKRIVFTNGCFDIIHVGHVRYLAQARAKGDCLIVAVNSDASVRGLEKGADRPFNPESQRAEVIAALACVDYVTIFPEPTPLELIKAVMPDVLAKGGDWQVDAIVGADVVAAAGGKVYSIPLTPRVSTTALIEAIRKTS